VTALRRLAGSEATAEGWSEAWRQRWSASEVLLLLAATDTAAVEGISAAGATPVSRRQTAAADAELLALGPAAARPHALPPLPAGVTPALISQVALEGLGLQPLLLDLGCPVAPAVPHLRLPYPAGVGAARCLSSGAAMTRQRVEALLALGRRWGERLAAAGRPLVLAECVPGGTTTAQGVLTGLGLEVGGLVSGSLRRAAHALKADLVARGLAAAQLDRLAAADHRGGQADGPSPEVACRAMAAFGDPMQPLAAALVLAATAAEPPLPVLLAGGSQMAAVLALALALAPPEQRPPLTAATAVATTAWVAGEADSDLVLLLQRIGERWGVAPLAFAADLRFVEGCHPALLDYERGYVKEGVGAGGLALLWQLSGRSPEALAAACDRACRSLLGSPGQTGV
jgi:uncharacterized protein (TIGR00303 family)